MQDTMGTWRTLWGGGHCLHGDNKRQYLWIGGGTEKAKCKGAEDQLPYLGIW